MPQPRFMSCKPLVATTTTHICYGEFLGFWLSQYRAEATFEIYNMFILSFNSFGGFFLKVEAHLCFGLQLFGAFQRPIPYFGVKLKLTLSLAFNSFGASKCPTFWES